ncbi:MAG: exodeoxyribonuclease III, partial [Spirochaetota bacterium]
SRLIAVRRDDLVIVNTYVPQGRAVETDYFRYKLEWFSRLKKYFAALQKKSLSVIWVGDFNVAPLPIDVHNPKRLLGSVGYHPDEHKALASVAELGFTDIFRKHVPGPGQYTFWDYRAKDALAKGLGWRVDHIWALGPIAEKSRRAWIDTAPRTWERPSDHTVIAAEFER